MSRSVSPRARVRRAAVLVAAAAVALSLSSPRPALAAAATERVSLGQGGVQGNSLTGTADMSASGRWVVFTGYSDNLVPGDTNGMQDVFLRDRVAGTTERVSLPNLNDQGTLGTEADDYSQEPQVSDDGRYVVFLSYATNLVVDDTNGVADVFLHDRQSGETDRVNVTTMNEQADGYTFEFALSGDGRRVAFASMAPIFGGGPQVQVFLRDLQVDTTSIVSTPGGITGGNGQSRYPAITADGRYVAFESLADDLVGGDTNATTDVYVRDTLSAVTSRVSLATGGGQGDHVSGFPSISDDGNVVAFASIASNFGGGGTDTWDVFVRDRGAGTTTFLSTNTSGGNLGGDAYAPHVSADGTAVAWETQAPESGVVPADTNGKWDVYLTPVASPTSVQRASLSSSGAQGAMDATGHAVTADGGEVLFTSNSPLVPEDTNSLTDAFVRVLDAGPPPAADRVSLTLTGGLSYANPDVALTSGDVEVATGGATVQSVSGSGTIPSAVSGSASVSFNVNRLWIFPLYLGTITLNDPAAGVNNLTHVHLFPNVTLTGGDTATSASTWFTFNAGFRVHTLTWSVTDVT